MRTIFCALLMILISSVSSVLAQQVRDDIQELSGIDVVEHLGDKIDLNLTFTNESGETVQLRDYFNNGKPVIITLGYYECPMLCNLVFNGLSAGVQQLDWTLGDKYQMVTVSIDPEETPELAQAKKNNYIAKIKNIKDQSGWTFLTGEENQSQALADALGFKYYYDETQDEYAHPAVAFVLTEDGTVSRYLYGIDFKKNDLRLSLLEASEGRIGNTIDRLILYCFHYDPDAKGYVVFAGNVMKLGGAATLVVLAGFIGILFARDRRKTKRFQRSIHTVV